MELTNAHRRNRQYVTRLNKSLDQHILLKSPIDTRPYLSEETQEAPSTATEE